MIGLAEAMMNWVGVDATAGAGLWPLTSWAERRAAVTGDRLGGESAVERDLSVALAAMRRQPCWYKRNIEVPLGHKPAPVFARSTEDGTYTEPRPLLLNSRDEHNDAVLRELAGTALEVIRLRIEPGEKPETVVADVLTTVFTGVDEMDTRPNAGLSVPEQALTLIADPERFERVLASVHALLGEAG